MSFAHEVLWFFLSSLEEGHEEVPMSTIEFLKDLVERGSLAIHKVNNRFLYASEGGYKTGHQTSTRSSLVLISSMNKSIQKTR